MHAHTRLTSSRLARNDFRTLDKFAVAGSLYLPVIAFLCPLSALLSKMFSASGSWRWLGGKATEHVVRLTRSRATSWQLIGQSVPYMNARCVHYIFCRTDKLHHLRALKTGSSQKPQRLCTLYSCLIDLFTLCCRHRKHVSRLIKMSKHIVCIDCSCHLV